jgi:hypothetical protein
MPAYVDAVTEQYEYEFTTALPASAAAGSWTSCCRDPSGGEYDRPFRFTVTTRAHVRVADVPSDDRAIPDRAPTQAIPQRFDSETESTLPAVYDPILLDGAAAMACDVAIAGVEAYYLEPETAAN